MALRKPLLWAAAAVAMAIVADCSHSTGITRPRTDEKVASSAVALKYASALFSGRVSDARSLVESDSQPVFGLVIAGMSQAVVTAKRLAIGNTHIIDGRAITILTGELCRLNNIKLNSPPDCVSNHDPNSANPIFKVVTTRQASGAWLVTLMPPGNFSSTSGSPNPSLAS